MIGGTIDRQHVARDRQAVVGSGDLARDRIRVPDPAVHLDDHDPGRHFIERLEGELLLEIGEQKMALQGQGATQMRYQLGHQRTVVGRERRAGGIAQNKQEALRASLFDHVDRERVFDFARG
ncbi:MAG: hypothetical protein WDO24_00160 [Pseudomonadota bacterium]